MNIILGSGLNAFLARHILGPDYQIVSAGPSRFYGVNPASADNYIYASDLLKPLEGQLKALNIDTKRHPYKCCWSFEGELVRGFDKQHCSFWLAKTYGIHIPGHLELVYPHRMEFDVYGTRVNQLYAALYEKYYPELQSSPNISSIQSIGPHKIIFNDGHVIEFEKCISTIPLDDLAMLVGHQSTYHGVDVSVVLLQSGTLDYEGFNQVFVVDPKIQFFKTAQVSEDKYLFYFLDRIDNPGLYLTPYIADFDLISGFFYPKCIPAGAIADVHWLKSYGITPLGMSAQWDPAMDISSSLHRLLKIADGAIE